MRGTISTQVPRPNRVPRARVVHTSRTTSSIHDGYSDIGPAWHFHRGPAWRTLATRLEEVSMKLHSGPLSFFTANVRVAFASWLDRMRERPAAR